MSSDNVKSPWYPDSITELTDEDLTARRYKQSILSLPYETRTYLKRVMETARQTQQLETVSATIDRAYRIEVASILDTEDVPVSRADYNIKYTIPPEGWVADHEFPTPDLVSEDALADAPINDGRTQNYSTTSVVTELAKDLIPHVDGIESQADVTRRGLKRLVGELSTGKSSTGYRSCSTRSGLESSLTESGGFEVSNPAPPLVDLYKGDANNGLCAYIASEVTDPPSEYGRVGEWADRVGTSPTTFEPAKRRPLYAYGVLEPSSEEATMPRLRVPDTPTVAWIRHAQAVAPDKVDVTELLQYTGRTKLIIWFINDADPNEWYSISAVARESPVSDQTMRKHKDVLVDAGIIEKKEQQRGSQTYEGYGLNSQSPLAAALIGINNAAVAHRKAYVNDQLPLDDDRYPPAD
jgi:hypothetical protein